MKQTVSLAWIAKYLGSDLAAMAPPVRPRFVPELVSMPYASDGIMILGAPDIQVIRGKSAREVLPGVIALLDGTRTVEDISSAMPLLSVDAVRQIVLMLYSRGLLDDGEGDRSGASDDVAAYFGRNLDITRMNHNRGEALARLRDATVALAMDCERRDAITDLFRSAGSPKVVLWDETEDRSDPVDLVFVASTSRTHALRHLARAWDSDSPALLVEMSESTARIGPIFLGQESACPQCFDRSCEPLPGKPSDEAFAFWTSLAANHAANIVTRVAIPALYKRAIAYPFAATSNPRTQFVVRLPGCLTCGVEPAFDVSDPRMTPWIYQNVAAMPPEELNYPRAYQAHFSVQNVELSSKPAEKYYGGAEVMLPSVKLLPRAVAGPVSLEDVATVLWLAGGFRETPQPSHIAPTGGNLKSPEFFICANGILGLDDGVYCYDAERHLLSRRSHLEAAHIQSSIGIAGPLPPCTIIATGKLKVVYQKYSDFAFRVIGLDAGVALSYLYRGAVTENLSITEFADFDESALTEAANIPTQTTGRVVTFVAGIDRGDARETTPAVVPFLREGLLDGLVSAMREPLTPSTPPTVAPDREIEAMLARISVRSYSSRVIDSSTFSDLLWRARSAIYRSPNPSLSDTQLTVASQLSGGDLGEGVFQFEQAISAFVRVAERFDQRDAASCVTQANLSLAPYFVFVAVDLKRALVTRGPRGYREALVSAGAVAANFAVEATKMGLGTCITAGLSAEGFRRLTRTDGLTVCPLILLCVGYEEQST